ncbi:MAG: bifunctional UDP-2,4-diacetamido-2,4,6-trideoxy-beta-L-altropyranose hydrolase/GNAT family N-acetyltransferase [Planctomycetaceae bacterium]|nr:bifunctional UDP-2,4-diacetamido-2,4,6-trideoxy-beta-L-altropyranose hydrolase/GNAT family N-acetyltransferase [Planctomycetaceae bacterium]
MNVVILTEGGRNIGLGHVSRAVSLCQAFEQCGAYPRLVVSGDSSVQASAASATLELLDWAGDASALSRRIAGADVIVVDSYLARAEAYDRIAAGGALCVWLDDHMRLPYPPGVIVNGAVNAVQLPYRYGGHHTFLLGARYLTLRKAFWNVPRRQVRDQAASVLITLGADDPRGLTAQVLARLAGQFPALHKTVIAGRFMGDLSAVRAAADKQTAIITSPSAEGMCQAMCQADLAVSAGGQTLCELAKTGTPAVTLCLGENQRANIQGWQDAGLVDMLDADEAGAMDKLAAAVESLLDAPRRMGRAQIAQEIMDGCTGTNVAQAVTALARRQEAPLTVRPATQDDCYDLWVWRNHPDVRRWCCSQDVIDYPTHRQWFARRLADADTVLCVAVDACGVKAGQIRFDIAGNRAEANVGLSPTHFGRKLGRHAIAAGTEHLLTVRPGVRQIDALIFPSNVASQKAFTAAGYRPAGPVHRNGLDLLLFQFNRNS